MKSNRKITQFTLVSIGIVLIFATYFLYPRFNENIIEKSIIKDETAKMGDEKSNVFENVEYKGFYNTDTIFSVKSEKAHILIDTPDLIYMDKMKVTIEMDDGRIVVITSNKGSYNKVTYDCFFENNVKATDGETVVVAKNMDLLASEDTASVYNNVALTSNENSLLADKVEYNFEKRYYQISMFNDKKVKIKLTK